MLPLSVEKSRLSVLFLSLAILACLMLSTVFFFDRIHFASQKNLWTDEHYGLRNTVRRASYAQLVVKGAQGQVSPAPLEYIAIKFIDQVREKVNFFGLRPLSYYRLWAIGVTAFSLLLIFALFVKDIFKQEEFWIQVLQIGLLALVPAAYLFDELIFYYATELRPYALWNALWMICLALGLRQTRPGILCVCLTLLTLTATSASFQISALALAYVLVHWFQERSWKPVVSNAVKIFGVPFLVTMYYCLKVGHYAWPQEESKMVDFLGWWIDKWPVMVILSAAFLLAVYPKETRKLAFVPLGGLLLFFLGPLIFWITRDRGFFMHPRQYIYYGLSIPIFLLTALQCLPVYFKNVQDNALRGLFVIGALVAAGFLAFQPQNSKNLQSAVQSASRLAHDPSQIQIRQFDHLYWRVGL